MRCNQYQIFPSRMYACALNLSPPKRSFSFYSQLMSASASSCTADFSSDSDVNPDSTHYSELQQRMQSHAASGSLRKALETMGFMRANVPGKPTVYDCNAMIRCYFKSGKVAMNELFEVYVGMKRFGPTPNLLTYNILVNGIVSVGGLKYAVFILEEILGSGWLPSYTIISKVLKKMLKVGSLVDAALVFDIMSVCGFNPTRSDLSALIQGLCKAGMVLKAYSVFSAYSEKGNICIGPFYNPILWTLCKSNQTYTALSFFGLLKKKGLYHSVYSYTALVYGFSNEGLWHEALHCLREMENVGCKPSLVTYTVIVKSLCDDNRIDDAISLLGEMEEKGCEPDLITYNIVIRELCLQGRLVESHDLIRVIDEKGLIPDMYTCAALAGGELKRGKVEIVNDLFFYFIKNGYSLDDVVFNIYLDSMCCKGSSEEAMSLIESMMEKGFFLPNNITYNEILKGLCKENKIEEAMKLFNCKNWPNNKGPDLIACNTILSAACKLGDSSLINQILQRMGNERINYDVVSLTCLIEYCCMVGKITDCLELVSSMVTNGPQPNTVTLNTLLLGLCKNRELEKAVNGFDYLRRIGVSPNISTYNILMRAAIRGGQNSMFIELAKDVNRQKLELDVGTYGCFIYRICKEGDISLALQIRHKLLEGGILPNRFIYHSIMKAMLVRGMFREILFLFKDMAVDGCEPNEETLQILKWAKTKLGMR